LSEALPGIARIMYVGSARLIGYIATRMIDPFENKIKNNKKTKGKHTQKGS
jgi:hypothetical protein